MTWSAAKAQAAPRAALMFERLRAGGAPPGAEVRLTIYDEAAWTIFGDSGGGEWSRADHEAITRAVARELRREGFRPRFVHLAGHDYLDWLVANGHENNAGTRARYAA